MVVELDGEEYHVRWRHISERVVHDPGWRLVDHQTVGSAKPRRVWEPPSHVRLILDNPVYKRFVKLRPPRRVSTMTSLCEIVNKAGVPMSWGNSYYSELEPLAGVKFSRLKAKAQSLKRALGMSLKDPFVTSSQVHRGGHQWSTSAIQTFLKAFGTLNARHPKKKASQPPRPASQS